MSKLFENSIVSTTLINRETGETIDLQEIAGNVAYEPKVEPRTVNGRQTKVCNLTVLVHEGQNREVTKNITASFWGNDADAVASAVGKGDFVAVTNCVFEPRTYLSKNGETRNTVDCKSLKGSNVRMAIKVLRKKSPYETFTGDIQAKAEVKAPVAKAAPAPQAKSDLSSKLESAMTSTKATAKPAKVELDIIDECPF